jgi:hypothetical protein
MLTDRRIATVAAALLWILGLCAFLPAVQGGTSQLEAPVAMLREAPLTMAAIVAPMLLAPILMVLTLVPLLSRRVPGRRTDGATAALVAATLPSALLVASLVSFLSHGIGELRWALADAAAALAALALLWRSRRADGWRRHQQRLAAFALASLPLALFIAEMLENEPAGPGAWLFVPAVFLLAAITLPTLLPPPPRAFPR